MYVYTIIFFVVICTAVVYFAVTTYENFESTIPENEQSDQKYEKPKLTCIVSSESGDTYCVRDTSKQKQAANLLARVTGKGQELIDKIVEHYPDHPIGKQLKENFNAAAISEILPLSSYTAVTENKEKISFCLTKKKDQEDDGLIDEHTLMFVFLHELTHVGSPTIGHPDGFWKSFRFILECARKFNIHMPANYKLKSKEYCGTTIKDNPFFDM